MTEEILNTLFYLFVVLWGIPTIYFTTSTNLSRKEMKSLAIKIYPALLFLILLITVLIYGVKRTKKAIGYAFSEAIFLIFFSVIIYGFFFVILILFLSNWKLMFERIQKKFKR